MKAGILVGDPILVVTTKNKHLDKVYYYQEQRLSLTSLADKRSLNFAVALKKILKILTVSPSLNAEAL